MFVSVAWKGHPFCPERYGLSDLPLSSCSMVLRQDTSSVELAAQSFAVFESGRGTQRPSVVLTSSAPEDCVCDWVLLIYRLSVFVHSHFAVFLSSQLAVETVMAEMHPNVTPVLFAWLFKVPAITGSCGFARPFHPFKLGLQVANGNTQARHQTASTQWELCCYPCGSNMFESMSFPGSPGQTYDF